MSSVSVKCGDIIKQFDGGNDFSEWIRKVELVARLQGVKELETFVPLFLSGGAFAVYESLPDDVKSDYSKLKPALYCAFSQNCFSAFDVLVNRCYRGGEETVDIYLAEIRRLTHLIQPTTNEAWIRCAFVRGLPQSIRTQLQALSSVEHLPFADLVERSRMMISLEEQNSVTFAAQVSSNSRQPRWSENKQDYRKCFSCGARGHIARRCPNKRRYDARLSEDESKEAMQSCANCGGIGHQSNVCPSEKRSKNE